MKHSKQVPLILLGAVTALSGCGQGNGVPATASRASYSNAADCRKDWGDGDWCRQTPNGHGGIAYAGPRYYWDRNAGRPMVVEDGVARAAAGGEASRGAPAHATSVESVAVARGGFGATAHGGGGGDSGGG
jgi:hypothetical protein